MACWMLAPGVLFSAHHQLLQPYTVNRGDLTAAAPAWRLFLPLDAPPCCRLRTAGEVLHVIRAQPSSLSLGYRAPCREIGRQVSGVPVYLPSQAFPAIVDARTRHLNDAEWTSSLDPTSRSSYKTNQSPPSMQCAANKHKARCGQQRFLRALS